MATRKRRTLWIAGGVALVMIILIVLGLRFGVKSLRPEIEASASKALGMDVRIRGGLNVSLLPVFGVSLADITATKGGAAVAGMASLKVGLKLLPLIRGRVEITRLELVKPRVSIVRQKNGTLNIETQGGGSSGTSLTVNKLSVSQGSLSFADLPSGQKIELDGLDLAVRDLHSGGPAGGKPLQALSFTGNLRCRAIKAGNVTLTDLTVELAGGQGVFEISRARVRAFGGTGTGAVRADLTGPEPHFKISYALSAFKIQDLLQGSANAKRMEGLADFSADLAATGTTGLELTQTLGGQASLTGENILLNGVDIDGLVGSLERTQNFNLADVGGFLLAGPLGTALSRGANLAGALAETQGGKGVITRLVSVWKVERGSADAADVALATKKYRIAVKGKLNFVSERFENIVVAVLDDRGCATFSQKIRGTFARPEIDKASTLKSLAGPLANLLGAGKKLMEPGPCVAFYSGSVASPVGGKRSN